MSYSVAAQTAAAPPRAGQQRGGERRFQTAPKDLKYDRTVLKTAKIIECEPYLFDLTSQMLDFDFRSVRLLQSDRTPLAQYNLVTIALGNQ